MTATVICQNCGIGRARFHRRMTNVDKFLCPRCGKFTFVGKDNSPQIDRISGRRGRLKGNYGCDGQYLGLKSGYMIFNHQNKAAKMVEALSEDYIQLNCNGHYAGVKFVMTDTDIMGRRFKLEAMRKRGIQKFFVYPHAARPDIVNDIYKEWIFTTAHFVSARGHVEIMESFGYSRPMEVIGWSLCPIRPFSPRQEAHKVLFAPIHPRCSNVDQDVNRGTFQRLAQLAYAGDIKLTVRFINSLENSGLKKEEHPNIKYTAGFMNQMYDQIDQADVVIGHQTFLYIAVARGVPAVAMATDMPTHVQSRRKPVLWARNWSKYVDRLAFPYDIMQSRHKGQTLRLLNRAVKSDSEIKDWKRRLIGSPFNKRKFLQKLEKYL